MNILNTLSLKSNSKIKINFKGGNLSSDAGLLLIKEFATKIGLINAVNLYFQTTDKAIRHHKDSENLMQMVYQIISAYFQDNCADELSKEPVFLNILEKQRLASQPTLSRFFNRMDEETLKQFDIIDKYMRNIIYSIKNPEQILLDLDSTLFATYGKQESNAFNYHYRSNGYHPLLCYDGLTGDLLKAELRDGATYCSKDADQFILPLLQEFLDRDIPTYLRGDSGFASNKLYQVCEENGCSYAIRLKISNPLVANTAVKDDDLYYSTKDNQIDYAVIYGEFMYKASTWNYPRRVVYKIEKPYGQMTHLYTFVVTNMDLPPEQVIKFYCGRGKMENFIKESKNGFDISSVSSHSKIVNANRMRMHMLAYNLFNWFKRLTLPEDMQRLQVNTIRLKLIKIAARVVKSARYITFKLCSSCPYKNIFYATLKNIQELPFKPQLE